MATDSLPRPPLSGLSAAASEDPAARRGVLMTEPNPCSGVDYLVVLHAPRTAGHGGADLRLRYVPDRAILCPDGWHTYALAASRADGRLEARAARILSDVANQLVPRWLEVRLQAGDDRRHMVVMRERQPQWPDGALAAVLRGAGGGE
jgi:hypothetical protein